MLSGNEDWCETLATGERRDAAHAGADQDIATNPGAGGKYGLDDAMRNARLFFYEEGSDEAGWLWRTSTRPTLNLLLLRAAV